VSERAREGESREGREYLANQEIHDAELIELSSDSLVLLFSKFQQDLQMSIAQRENAIRS